MTNIKICGLSRLEDIHAVNDAKPQYMGFVFAKSRRQVSPETAATLRSALDDDIIPVGVFVNAALELIVSLVQRGVISMVQLHGNEDEAYIHTLKKAINVPIIQAVSMESPGDAQRMDASPADFLLLDHKGGGTGTQWDWNLLGDLQKPFFLAGGIHIENVTEAIRKTSPFAVDVSSGVETNGYKDYDKIQTIVRSVQHVKY